MICCLENGIEESLCVYTSHLTYQGCCNSRQADDDPSRPAPTHHHSTRRTAHRKTTTDPDRPNKSLRPVSPVPKCPPERALQPWTHSQLERERIAFFETRVSGDPQIWIALRHVCDLLRAGDTSGAQTVLDSVGCTCPTGRIKSDRIRGTETRGKKGGIFDERGNSYEIPGWLVADPGDIVAEPEREIEEIDGVGTQHRDEEKSLDGQSHDEGHVYTGDKDNDTKKGAGEMVTVRARLSDRGSDLSVETGLHSKVKALVKKVQQEACMTGRVKLIYLGKELSEEKSLAQQGWQTGHVVSVFVFE